MAKDSALELPAKSGKDVLVDDDNLFGIPVDSEHKAKVLRIFSFQRPHMSSFHLNWVCFFVSFLCTFAAAPLIPTIRDCLNLTKQQVQAANIAAVTGTIASRIAMGVICDSLGPRFGHGVIMLLTSCATFGMTLVTDAAGFITVRCLIGMALATFVSCQYWTSAMFSPNVVGLANATAGGWGNLGGGVTQLLMPYLFNGFHNIYPACVAWRVAYYIPGSFQVIIAMLVLMFGQDLPDGNYEDLVKSGEKDKAKSHREFIAGISNYRTWCLLLTYGYCFGVELTLDNQLAEYFHDNFNLEQGISGIYASLFGLANIFARALGGFVSDLSAKYFGMRGRLWSLWIVQTLAGIVCIVIGLLHTSLAGTMVALVIFSVLIPMSCGATYGVVPFVSRRSLGVVSGFVGAGGNAGAAITQAIFFTPQNLPVYDGFKWMGIMVIGMTLFVIPVWFPMWGSMFTKPREGATEEEYYRGDFTGEEQQEGLHRSIMKFANESKSQRGFKKHMELVNQEAKTATV